MKHLLGFSAIGLIGYGIHTGQWSFGVVGCMIGFYAIALAASSDSK